MIKLIIKILTILFFLFVSKTYAKYHNVTLHFNDGSEKELFARFPIGSNNKFIQTKKNEKAKSVRYKTETIKFMILKLNNGVDQKLFKFGRDHIVNRKGKLYKMGLSKTTLTVVTGVYGDLYCSEAGYQYTVKSSKKDGEYLLIRYQNGSYMRYLSKLDDDKLVNLVLSNGKLSTVITRASEFLFEDCAYIVEKLEGKSLKKMEELDSFLKEYESCSSKSK